MEDYEQNRLEKFIVGSLPTIAYIPDFITEAEQNHLLQQINSAPMSKWKSLKNRRLQNWGGVVHEKGLLPQALPSWLSTITQKICDWTGLFPSPINHVLINEYLPGQGIMPHQDGPAYFPVVAILSLGSPAVMTFTPHPKLITLQHNGNNEIFQTKFDGSQEDIGHKDNYMSRSAVLLPRSLLIFRDSAYEDYLHGIEDCTVHQFDEAINIDAVSGDTSNSTCVADFTTNDDIDKEAPAKNRSTISRTGTRVSLTCRLVPKVIKNLIKL